MSESISISISASAYSPAYPIYANRCAVQFSEINLLVFILEKGGIMSPKWEKFNSNDFQGDLVLAGGMGAECYMN